MTSKPKSSSTTTKKSQTTPAILKTSDTHEPLSDFDAVKWELENVHDVYSSIASHFSATRYKPWPLVTEFLASLPAGSIGVDVGCGNGKYLHLRNILHTSNSGQDTPSTSSSPSVVTRDCLTIGVDRSAELIDLAQDMTLDKMASGSNASAREEAATSGTSSRRRTNEVAVGDGLSSGFRSHAFDYAISIATIHHFSTRQRRRESIQELIRLVQPVESQTDDQSAMGGRGRFLVYVWALEQRGQERRKFDEDDSRRRGDLNSSSNNTDNDGVPQGRDVLVPWVLRKETAAAKEDQDAEQEDKVFQRYYHLFEQGELESLVQEAIDGTTATLGESIRVVREDSGWERGNWWGVWKVCRQS